MLQKLIDAMLVIDEQLRHHCQGEADADLRCQNVFKIDFFANVSGGYLGSAQLRFANLARPDGLSVTSAAGLSGQDPLGVGPTEWTEGRDGEPRADSGLRLLPRDLLKLGQLVLAGGAWNGNQIVPAEWIQ